MKGSALTLFARMAMAVVAVTLDAEWYDFMLLVPFPFEGIC